MYVVSIVGSEKLLLSQRWDLNYQHYLHGFNINCVTSFYEHHTSIIYATFKFIEECISIDDKQDIHEGIFISYANVYTSKIYKASPENSV